MNEEMRKSAPLETTMNGWSDPLNTTNQTQGAEPLLLLTKIQQKQCLDLSLAGIDYLKEICAAGWAGDAEQTWETYIESSRGLFKTCQDSLKEQAKVRYELWQSFIPGTGKSLDA